MEKETKKKRELPTNMADMSATAQTYALLRKEDLDNKQACKRISGKFFVSYTCHIW